MGRALTEGLKSTRMRGKPLAQIEATLPQAMECRLQRSPGRRLIAPRTGHGIAASNN